MEPNKFEIKIREQLNTREIKPTSIAWDRLDAMLSVSEEKKTKCFPFFTSKFIGIAASVLVFLSVGLYFINQENTAIKIEDSVVVKEEVKINTANENNITSEDINPILVQPDDEVASTENNESQTINKKSPKSFNQNNQKTKSNSIINKNKEIEYLINGDVALKNLPKIETKSQTIVAKPNYVNVDELLASVEKVSNEKAKTTIKVNTSSLLAQVDGELEQTFREKTINKISRNFQEVKVALANRNQK